MASASRKIEKKQEKNEVVFPKVELFLDQILTTAFTRDVTSSGLILADKKGNIKTDQIVVAAGPHSSLKPGDKVEIAPERFRKTASAPKYDVGPDVVNIEVPIEIIDDVPYLFMSMRELKFKYLSE
jgi:hypothetical protein